MSGRALLDDEAVLRKIDRSGMMGMIANLADDMATQLQGDGHVRPEGTDVANVVFSGMGGSAIGGDILRSWLGSDMDIPILVQRGYHAPPFVDKGTLFVSVSFSGNTEETLSAFDEAIGKGCNVVALSTGGKLEDKAAEARVPFIKITAPDGMVPRAALGIMLVPMALMLERAGMVKVQGDLKEAIEVLGKVRKDLDFAVPFEDNQAKRIATTLEGSTPVINGHGVLEVAALRWKCQLNENSKVLAWADNLPEMDHNTIVGWTGDDASERYTAVVLRDRISEASDPRLNNRVEATKDSAWKKAKNMVEVESNGKGRLARIMSTIYKGDYTSVYLALLRNIDPTPVEAIEGLKSKLKEMGP